MRARLLSRRELEQLARLRRQRSTRRAPRFEKRRVAGDHVTARAGLEIEDELLDPRGGEHRLPPHAPPPWFAARHRMERVHEQDEADQQDSDDNAACKEDPTGEPEAHWRILSRPWQWSSHRVSARSSPETSSSTASPSRSSAPTGSRWQARTAPARRRFSALLRARARSREVSSRGRRARGSPSTTSGRPTRAHARCGSTSSRAPPTWPRSSRSCGCSRRRCPPATTALRRSAATARRRHASSMRAATTGVTAPRRSYVGSASRRTTSTARCRRSPAAS